MLEFGTWKSDKNNKITTKKRKIIFWTTLATTSSVCYFPQGATFRCKFYHVILWISLHWSWSFASAFVDLVVSLTQKSTFISIVSGKRSFLHNIFIHFLTFQQQSQDFSRQKTRSWFWIPRAVHLFTFSSENSWYRNDILHSRKAETKHTQRNHCIVRKIIWELGAKRIHFFCVQGSSIPGSGMSPL